MDDLVAFREGVAAYRSGDCAAAAEQLAPLTRQEGFQGRTARYYSAMAHREMAIEQIESKHFAEAACHLREAIRLVGNRADLAEYLLAAYAGTGQYDRCADQAEMLSRARPADVRARLCLALSQWRSGRPQDAAMTLTRALRQLGDHAGLHLNLALFHAADGRLDDARDHLLKAVECDCTSAAAWRHLAMVESARGDYFHAARAYRRVLAVDPADLMSLHNLCLAADAAAQAGAPVAVVLPDPAPPPSASAVRRLADYVVDQSDFVEALLALPESAADGELFTMLLSVLRTALACHDGYADLHYFAGMALTRVGDLQAAREHLERAVEINPRYVRALTQLAELAERDDLPRAAAYLQRAVAAGGDFPDLHTRLGELLKECGSVELAKEHYARALQLNPQYDRAAAGLARLAA